jgi:phosphoglycolate phosphatase
MKKGIIFDVDGTLWDASAVVADSWNLYVQKHVKGIDFELTEEDIRSVMGKTMDQIEEILFDKIDKEHRKEITQGCFDFEVEYMQNRGGVLYPDMAETFAKLAENYHLYIVSNCQEGYIEDFLDWSGMDEYIEDFENFGRTGKGKSHNIRLIVERNQLDQAVYIGDIQGDFDSTREAGLPFIHARYGFGSIDEEVPYINGLKELPEVVEQIFEK